MSHDARGTPMIRNLDRWIGSYVRGLNRARPDVDGLVHVILCVADHFEPMVFGVGGALQRERVNAWSRGLPPLARAHQDADGHPFQYTFFYPAEEYVPAHLDALADLRAKGIADVEVHLHHDRDTSDGLRQKLCAFTSTLHDRHGLLRRNRATGRIEYAFIHGNWALANSGRHGAWCGVDDELSVLQETGCYADFTMPAAPDWAQTRKINSLYYANPDRIGGRAPHDDGYDLAVGKAPRSTLLLVQGPLTLNWRRRKFGVLPRIENGELSGDNPPSPDRADQWIAQHIHVHGRPDWVFVKLHTHGAVERNARVLLGGAMGRTLSYLERAYNDGTRYALHYVTAREMYSLVKAAEAGFAGDPGLFRRWVDGPSALAAVAAPLSSRQADEDGPECARAAGRRR